MSQLIYFSECFKQIEIRYNELYIELRKRKKEILTIF